MYAAPPLQKSRAFWGALRTKKTLPDVLLPGRAFEVSQSRKGPPQVMCGADFLPEGLVVLGEAAGFSIFVRSPSSLSVFVLRTLVLLAFGF